ncbi:hypothetical protein BH09MYX1_BH09MYX1_64020 [soil metagenome]
MKTRRASAAFLLPLENFVVDAMARRLLDAAPFASGGLNQALAVFPFVSGFWARMTRYESVPSRMFS